MYVPNNTPGGEEAAVAKGLLALVIIVGLAVLAIGVAMAQTPVPKSGATPVPTPSTQTRGAYHMRCWQYGRLVLEEQLAQAPADGTPQTLRLQGAQGAGSAYTLLNTGTTTCLIKPSSERWAYVPGTR
jgi:hypothetical protein